MLLCFTFSSIHISSFVFYLAADTLRLACVGSCCAGWPGGFLAWLLNVHFPLTSTLSPLLLALILCSLDIEPSAEGKKFLLNSPIFDPHYFVHHNDVHTPRSLLWRKQPQPHQPVFTAETLQPRKHPGESLFRPLQGNHILLLMRPLELLTVLQLRLNEGFIQLHHNLPAPIFYTSANKDNCRVCLLDHLGIRS